MGPSVLSDFHEILARVAPTHKRSKHAGGRSRWMGRARSGRLRKADARRRRALSATQRESRRRNRA